MQVADTRQVGKHVLSDVSREEQTEIERDCIFARNELSLSGFFLRIAEEQSRSADYAGRYWE